MESGWEDMLSGRRRFWLVLLCAFFAAALPFHAVLFDWGKVLLFRDLSLSFLPAKKFWLQQVLAEGRVPLWNSYALGGTSFYADCNQQPLYPLNLLFFLFPQARVANAFMTFLVLHYALLYAGAYLLLRRLGTSFLSALLFAFVFAWSGYSISSNNVPHILAGQAWSLWFFWAFLGYLRGGHALLLFASSAFLALPIYAGDPQFTYLLALFALPLAFFHRPWKRALFDYAALGALAVLCAGAQLLPTLDLLRETDRAGAEINSGFSRWSLHPLRLFEVLFPNLFGNIVPYDHYTLGEYINFDGKKPFLFANYLPVLAVFGAAAAAASWKALPLRLRWIVCALPLALWICFGVFAPWDLYSRLGGIVPGWSLFRYPERLLLWPLWGMLLLAAWSFDRFRTARAGSETRIQLRGIAAAGAVILAAALWAHWHGLPAEIYRESLWRTLAIAGCIGLVLFLQLRRGLHPRIFLLLAAAITLFELYTSARTYVWEQSATLIQAESHPHFVKIRQDMDARAAELRAGAARRIYFQNPFRFDWRDYKVAGLLDMIGAEATAAWRNGAGNIASWYGTEAVTGYYTMQPVDSMKNWVSLSSNPQRLLDILGAYYVRPFEPAERIPRVIVNKSALPYVHSTAGVRGVMLTETAQQVLLMSGFDPLKESVLIVPRADFPLPERWQTFSRAEILRRDSSSIRVRVSGDFRDGFLLLLWNERFNPHWRAYAGGAVLPILKANAWAMGAIVSVSRGAKDLEVEFRYENPWIARGLWLTGLWLALLALQLTLFRSKKLQAIMSTAVQKRKA